MKWNKLNLENKMRTDTKLDDFDLRCVFSILD